MHRKIHEDVQKEDPDPLWPSLETHSHSAPSRIRFASCGFCSAGKATPAARPSKMYLCISVSRPLLSSITLGSVIVGCRGYKRMDLGCRRQCFTRSTEFGTDLKIGKGPVGTATAGKYPHRDGLSRKAGLRPRALLTP